MRTNATAIAGCTSVVSSMRYAIRPKEARKVSIETKSNPCRTGRCQISDIPMELPSTIRFRKREMAADDRNAEKSHTAGGHGFVNTIFRLRLRRWEEMMNRPNPAP